MKKVKKSEKTYDAIPLNPAIWANICYYNKTNRDTPLGFSLEEIEELVKDSSIDERKTLWGEYLFLWCQKHQCNEEQRHAYILEFMPQVMAVGRKIARVIKSSKQTKSEILQEDIDDIITLTYIENIGKFNPFVGCPFLSYISYWLEKKLTDSLCLFRYDYERKQRSDLLYLEEDGSLSQKEIMELMNISPKKYSFLHTCFREESLENTVSTGRDGDPFSLADIIEAPMPPLLELEIEDLLKEIPLNENCKKIAHYLIMHGDNVNKALFRAFYGVDWKDDKINTLVNRTKKALHDYYTNDVVQLPIF